LIEHVLIVRLSKHSDIAHRIGEQTFRPDGLRGCSKGSYEVLIRSLPAGQRGGWLRKIRQAMRGSHDVTVVIVALYYEPSSLPDADN
jgi:hypothetical protein